MQRVVKQDVKSVSQLCRVQKEVSDTGGGVRCEGKGERGVG